MPLALDRGYRNLVLAHEKSADTGNLVWDATGEEINHQWGKSLEAETLLAAYVDTHLLPGCRYFSLLKSVHDLVIFAALQEHLDSVEATHSCNLDKPWCRRCPKCLYVFLGYAAFLPRAKVLRIFGDNLFDVTDNLDGFSRLLGATGHLPFECVGPIEESRVLLALAARRGWTGLAIDRFQGDRGRAPIDRLSEVRENPHRIPEEIASRVIPLLERRATRARAFLDRQLGV